MHKNVEILIGRLATDKSLQNRFSRDAYETIRQQGLELTDVELTALAAIDPNAFRVFTAAVDARLCKASLADEPFRTEANKETRS
jgi:hypothetical protein